MKLKMTRGEVGRELVGVDGEDSEVTVGNGEVR